MGTSPLHCTALHCRYEGLHCSQNLPGGLSRALSPQIKSAEDRFFCKIFAPQTCANSCAGQPCTQHCTVICGFWFFYRRLCSAVASTTCVPAATTAAAPTT